MLVQPWIRASPGCGIDVLWRALGTQGAPCPFFALLMRAGMSIFAFLPPAARASARAVIWQQVLGRGAGGADEPDMLNYISFCKAMRAKLKFNGQLKALWLVFLGVEDVTEKEGLQFEDVLALFG